MNSEDPGYTGATAGPTVSVTVHPSAAVPQQPIAADAIDPAMRETVAANLGKARAREQIAALWLGLGASKRAALYLSRAGCRTLADIQRVGWGGFLRAPGCGRQTLGEIGDLIGGWPELSPGRPPADPRQIDMLAPQSAAAAD